MNRVLRNNFFLAMAIIVALAGCTKSDADYSTGVGLLKVNGKEDSISKVVLKTSNYDSSHYGSGYGSYYPGNELGALVTFFNEKKNPIVTVNLNDLELTSNTYTIGEGGIYFLALSINLDYYGLDDGSVVMVVDKSDNIYDISITGKTLLGEHEYTITYKGTIREEK